MNPTINRNSTNFHDCAVVQEQGCKIYQSTADISGTPTEKVTDPAICTITRVHRRVITKRLRVWPLDSYSSWHYEAKSSSSTNDFLVTSSIDALAQENKTTRVYVEQHSHRNRPSRFERKVTSSLNLRGAAILDFFANEQMPTGVVLEDQEPLHKRQICASNSVSTLSLLKATREREVSKIQENVRLVRIEIFELFNMAAKIKGSHALAGLKTYMHSIDYFNYPNGLSSFRTDQPIVKLYSPIGLDVFRKIYAYYKVCGLDLDSYRSSKTEHARGLITVIDTRSAEDRLANRIRGSVWCDMTRDIYSKYQINPITLTRCLYFINNMFSFSPVNQFHHLVVFHHSTYSDHVQIMTGILKMIFNQLEIRYLAHDYSDVKARCPELIDDRKTPL